MIKKYVEFVSRYMTALHEYRLATASVPTLFHSRNLQIKKKRSQQSRK